MSGTALHPSTVFDRPQATLVPDDKGIRLYGNVSNRLEISFTNRPTFYVPLAVPTMLFTLMRDVLHVDTEIMVSLAIDQVGPFYVFSLMVGMSSLYDLWYYTEETLPVWIHEGRAC